MFVDALVHPWLSVQFEAIMQIICMFQGQIGPVRDNILIAKLNPGQVRALLVSATFSYSRKENLSASLDSKQVKRIPW